MTDQFDENGEFASEELENQVADPSVDHVLPEYTSQDELGEFIADEESPRYSAEQELESLPDSAFVAQPVPSRVEALTAAIELHPDAPVNYVFRGEAMLEDGYYAEAAVDFEKALDLADSLAETANWGYIYRGLADRARVGLRRCS